MELACSASASLNSRAVLSVIPRSTTSRTQSPSFLPIRNSYSQSSFFASTSNNVKRVCFLPISTSRFQQSSLVATNCISSTVPNESVQEVNPTTEQSNPVVYNEATGDTCEADKNSTSEELEELQRNRACDKLINVFLIDKPTPTEWRVLLVFSKEWDNIRPHFYKRCLDKAENEGDPGMKQRLLRLARKLKEVDEDVQRHNALLNVIRSSPSEINEIVAKCRKDFTNEFFLHLHTVAQSYFNNPTEQNAMIELGEMSFAAVQAYDAATEKGEALYTAEQKFQDIMNSPSLDSAAKKLNDLAAKNELDSALALTIAKAWSAAKDTDLTRDEAKEGLYELYMISLRNLQKNVPKEIRIVKHLLRMANNEECIFALNNAFTLGLEIKGEIEGSDVEFLYTTPEKLYHSMKFVVDAYRFSKNTVIREARDLMNPNIMMRLEELMKLIEDKFF